MFELPSQVLQRIRDAEDRAASATPSLTDISRAVSLPGRAAAAQQQIPYYVAAPTPPAGPPRQSLRDLSYPVSLPGRAAGAPSYLAPSFARPNFAVTPTPTPAPFDAGQFQQAEENRLIHSWAQQHPDEAATMTSAQILQAARGQSVTAPSDVPQSPVEPPFIRGPLGVNLSLAETAALPAGLVGPGSFLGKAGAIAGGEAGARLEPSAEQATGIHTPVVNVPLLGPMSTGQTAAGLFGAAAGYHAPTVIGGVEQSLRRSIAQQGGLAAEAGGTGLMGNKAYFPDAPQPSPEGMNLTAKGFPAGREIREADIANIAARGALPRSGLTASGAPTAALKRLTVESATINAQADIDKVLRSGLPIQDQWEQVNNELKQLSEEQMARLSASDIRGVSVKSWRPTGRTPFGQEIPPQEGRLTRSAFKAEMAFQRRPFYPNLDNAQFQARSKVYQDFIDNVAFVPAEPGVAQATLGGGAQPLFATEAERQGYRAAQGQLGIGAGTQPVETAGPLFAQKPPETAPPPAAAPPAEPPIEPPPAPPGEPPTGPPPSESGPQKIIEALGESRQNIKTTEATRTIERGQRIGASQKAYDAAIAGGAAPQEANIAAQRALGGKYAGVAGVNVDLTPEEVGGMAQKINDFNFGRGGEGIADFRRNNTRVALFKMLGGEPLQSAEVDKLEQVFGPDFGKALRLSQRMGHGVDVLGAAYNASQLVKQFALIGHIPHMAVELVTAGPRAGGAGNVWEAIANSARAGVKGDAVAQGIDEALRTNPTVVTILGANGAKQSTTLGEIMNAGAMRSLNVGSAEATEFAKGSHLIERLPVLGRIFKASNRAFVSFDNSLGQSVTEKLLNNAASLSPDGAIPADRVQAIINLQNRMRLRGTLAGDIKVPLTDVSLTGGHGFSSNTLTQALETVMWTPRLAVAPVQNWMQLLHPDAFIRGEAAKQLAAMTSAGVGLMALAKYGLGAKIGGSPNADFGKIVIGNTHINVFGPQQRIARMIYQIGSGQDPVTIAGRYAQASLNPLTSLGLDLFTGKDYLGNEVGIGSPAQLKQLVQDRSPITVKNIWDAWHAAYDDPSLAKIGVAAGTSPLAVLGGRVETYNQSAVEQRNALSQKLTGMDYNDPMMPLAKKQELDANPDIQALSKQVDESQRQRGDTGQQVSDIFNAQRQQIIDKQTNYDTAFNSGQMDARTWRDNQRTLLAQAGQSSSDRQAVEQSLGVTFKTPAQQSADRSALDAYFNVTTEPFTDKVTQEVNWADFFAAREKALSGLSQGDRKAVEAVIEKNMTPTQKEFRVAATTLRDLPAQHTGLSTQQDKELRTIDRVVAQLGDKLARDGVDTAKMSDPQRETLYGAAAKQAGLSDQAGQVAFLLRPGSRGDKKLANPNYAAFLIQHQDQLLRFYPDLYSHQTLLEASKIGAGR